MIDHAKQLNQAIRDSEEYRNYQDALAAVRSDEKLYHEMNSFRRRNYELQNFDDGINRYGEIHALRLEFDDTLRHPVVDRFLVAEQILSKTMADMYEEIAEGLELDYNYME